MKDTLSGEHSQPKYIMRQPNSHDGFVLNQLIKNCPPLDGNSVYCNLLQCSHFAETCVLTELDNNVVASSTGYLKPADINTLFVWQIAVHADHRGQGLAEKMLIHQLAAKVCRNVRFLETTISDDNEASWRLFMSFAKKLQADTEKMPCFDQSLHFNNEHESEILLRIGPFEHGSSFLAENT